MQRFSPSLFIMQSMTERHMNRHGRLLALLPILLLVPGPSTLAFELGDAQRLATLLENTAYRPSAMEVERDYLAPASPALSALLGQGEGPAAARQGETLQRALSEQRFAYRHAVTLCLPVAEQLGGELTRWQAEVGQWVAPDTLSGAELAPGGTPSRYSDLVPEPADHVPVHLVFGDGLSGGTVRAGHIVLALEVLCRFATDPESAARVLEAAVRHETVHVHQLRLQRPEVVNSLLRQALIEGLADWVTAAQMDGQVPQEAVRKAYGERHEGALWQAFRPVMNSKALGHWMYGPGAGEQPADLGYWLGKRIVAAYLRNAPDRGQAIDELMHLEDPARILQVSRYAPGASPAVPAHATPPGDSAPR